MGKKEEEVAELFETKEARYRGVYRLFASTVMVGICLIWFYRLKNLSRAGEEGILLSWIGILLSWIGMFMAELGYGLYWIITQSVRWSLTRFHPFKERLSHRYEDKVLPYVDIFVCTADPVMEPPTLMINTVLSAMSYNYPPEKLSVYLSDDGCSELTFYALLEASRFAKYWIPFCKRFEVEPRSPEAYFAQQFYDEQDGMFAKEWLVMKELYEEMKGRIESAVEMGKVPKERGDEHKGFLEWNLTVTKKNHHSIVQILIDGRDSSAVDDEESRLPTLVYMAREKRPNCPHNFKAGAMNALIRVSSEMSNGPIILNLDCDMYSNNADTVREILCFFMDEKKGGEFAFVQFPQNYTNITKNDHYANVCLAVNEIELPGVGGYGAALYCGTGCFHRRECLGGKKYSKDEKGQHIKEERKNVDKTINELEEASKLLASCTYEKDTKWGKEIGLLYGCPVEDIVTGLTIQCRGWKSVYYNPDRKAFLGVAPTTLEVALVQHKRWCEGMSQIFLSKYCPFTFGHGKIKLGAQMGYSIYLLWAPLSLPTLCYVIVPSLCLLNGISIFPEVSSPWFLPFAYVFVAKNAYSVIETMSCGSTLKAWWNLQRMWLIRRTTSYFFAFIDIIKRHLGLGETTFALTDKVVTEDVSKRYEQEVMEFGSSIMFTLMATLALLNLFSLVGGIRKLAMDFENLIVQNVLCGLIVLVNFPIYEALFVRSDKGNLPSSIMFKSIVLASLACLMPIY